MATKPPGTVLVALHGGSPNRFSEMSDLAFAELEDDEFYHLLAVPFDVYCEWMFNVKTGSIVKTVVPVSGPNIVQTFTFERGSNGGSYTLGASPPPYHQVSADTFAIAPQPTWIISDPSQTRFVHSNFFHRGKFYFQFDDLYSSAIPGNGLITGNFSASKTELIGAWTGIQSGQPFSVTLKWKASSKFYP